MLAYCLHEEKTFEIAKLSDSMQEFIDTLPEKMKERMAYYIDERDGGYRSKEPGVSRNTSPKKNAPVKVTTPVQWINDAGAGNYDEWLTWMVKKGLTSPNTQEKVLRVTTQRNIDFLVRQTNDYLRKQQAATPTIDLIKKREHHFSDRKQWYNVESTRIWIEGILAYNGIDKDTTYDYVLDILLKEKPKRNAIWIYGRSNAGKSVWARSIIDGFPNHGQLLPSKDFMFQDCQDVPIIFSEETRITFDVVSDFKKVLEGTAIHANRKHKEPFLLNRTPMICCSNETPWQNVKAEQEALRNRLHFMFFAPREQLKECKYRLNPMFWYEKLADRCAATILVEIDPPAGDEPVSPDPIQEPDPEFEGEETPHREENWEEITAELTRRACENIDFLDDDDM